MGADDEHTEALGFTTVDGGGEEFGDREGYILIFRSQRWHNRQHDCLDELGFVWMKQNVDVREYITIYDDGLALGMRKWTSSSAKHH